ncbi:MAG: hypothetical protein ACOCSE_00280 [Chitinivibrionales bacterium]
MRSEEVIEDSSSSSVLVKTRVPEGDMDSGERKLVCISNGTRGCLLAEGWTD